MPQAMQRQRAQLSLNVTACSAQQPRHPSLSYTGDEDGVSCGSTLLPVQVWGLWSSGTQVPEGSLPPTAKENGSTWMSEPARAWFGPTERTRVFSTCTLVGAGRRKITFPWQSKEPGLQTGLGTAPAAARPTMTPQWDGWALPASSQRVLLSRKRSLHSGSRGMEGTSLEVQQVTTATMA